MKVMMVSDTERKGGAGIAASRLAAGLVKKGCDVIRVVRDPDTGTQTSLPWRRVILRGPARSWSQVPDPDAESAVLEHFRRLLYKEQPDVVNIHNIHGGLKEGFSHTIVDACAQFVPTIWTLHDMWSFTGRCVYNDGCREYLKQCGSDCPTVDTYPRYAREQIRNAHEHKARILASNKYLVAVAPSDWMAEKARQGIWPNERVRVIRNGLDLKRFAPRLRQQARRRMGIDTDGPVLLATAQNLSDPRKGIESLENILKRVPKRPLCLLLMGEKPPVIDVKDVRVLELGMLDEDGAMTAYNAADCYLHPAKQDNLPNTVMEAQASGTPCVCFGIGGIPEMVIEGMTGCIANDVSSDDFGQALLRFLGILEQGCTMTETCRKRALARHDQNAQAAAYLSQFHEMGAR